MKDAQTKNSVDAAVPKSEAIQKLKETEKRSLELQEEAEHKTGTTRKELEDKARQKAEE